MRCQYLVEVGSGAGLGVGVDQCRAQPRQCAGVLGLDQDLLPRAGLPPPAGDPLAHASPGVPVRIGMWHR